MDRRTQLGAVKDALGTLQLVWFGTRGDDVEAVANLPQLGAVFSMINTYTRRSSIRSLSLEDLTGVRVDLDSYEIDDEPHTTEMNAFRRAILGTLSQPSALFTYRPTTFVSAICFARRDRCRYLGLFRDHQAAFEHKPWLETAVADFGIPHIPWTYIADDEQLDTLRVLREGPVMLRRSRTSGGVGLVMVESAADLSTLWPEEDEAYVSVAPYIAAALPVNVGAVVWDDGVTLHPPSVQLIGIPELTRRPFGFCGNDFGAAAQLDRQQLRAIDAAVRRIGEWLHSLGYRGAFGVDFLVDESGAPLFTEVNPRLQGSTHASCQISVKNDESCILLDHVAALLGLAAPPSATLDELVARSGALAHFVVHWQGAEPTAVDVSGLVSRVMAHPRALRADVLPGEDTTVAPDATVGRFTIAERLTTSGFELAEPHRRVVAGWREGIRLATANGGQSIAAGSAL